MWFVIMIKAAAEAHPEAKSSQQDKSPFPQIMQLKIHLRKYGANLHSDLKCCKIQH